MANSEQDQAGKIERDICSLLDDLHTIIEDLEEERDNMASQITELEIKVEDLEKQING